MEFKILNTSWNFIRQIRLKNQIPIVKTIYLRRLKKRAFSFNLKALFFSS